MSGSRHSFRLALPNYPVCNATGVATGYQDSLYTTDYDGSYAISVAGASNSSDNNAQALPFSISDNDGLYYHFPYLSSGSSGGSQCFADCGLPDYIEDRNGNQIQFKFASTNSTLPMTIDDTAGRSLISIPSFTSASGDHISISGISNPYILTWETISFSATIPTNLPSSTCNTQFFTGVSGSLLVIKSITLPNQETYQFSYDQTYGLVNKITYPTVT